jgi:hypothetical protein
MSARSTEPENKNFLSPIGFQFTIQRLPHVNYFCTSALIPDVALGQIAVETPFVRMPQAGDKLDFGSLNLRFRIDEDMKNYKEIYDWIISLGYPDNFDQRPPHMRTNPQNRDGKTVFSDASLIITTNQYKPNVEVKFTDLYPVSLSSLEFNIESTDVDYLQGDVMFQYRKYDLNTIT